MKTDNYSVISEFDHLEAPVISVGGGHFTQGYGFFGRRMLREINHDDMTPKKHDNTIQNEIYDPNTKTDLE